MNYTFKYLDITELTETEIPWMIEVILYFKSKHTPLTNKEQNE